MEPILEFVAEILLWGSVALLTWGAMLTFQHLFSPARKRVARRDPAAQDDPARRARHAGLASAVIAAALVLPAPGAGAQDDGELGFMLVHGERVYGAAARQDAREGLMWVQCAADQGSPVARFSPPRLNSMSIANGSANDD